MPKDFAMKTISQFLDHSQRAIYSVSPDDTVRQALEVMALHNIGALLVLKEQKLVGIFSERDYARSVQAKLKKLTNLKDQH